MAQEARLKVGWVWMGVRAACVRAGLCMFFALVYFVGDLCLCMDFVQGL